MNPKDIILRVVGNHQRDLLPLSGLGLTTQQAKSAINLLESSWNNWHRLYCGETLQGFLEIEGVSQKPDMYNLRTLDFSNNRISSTQFLDKYQGRRHFCLLDLSNNEIHEVNNSIIVGAEIDLSNNRLTNESFKNLNPHFPLGRKIIHIAGNYIEDPESLVQRYEGWTFTGIDSQKIDPSKLQAEIIASAKAANEQFGEMQEAHLKQMVALNKQMLSQQEQMKAFSEGLLSMNNTFSRVMNSSQEAILAQNKKLEQINDTMMKMAESHQNVSELLFDGLADYRSQALWGTVISILVTIAGFVFYWWIG